MTEIEKVKCEIKVLEAKLALLEEMEKHKSPEEEAYKRVYGCYPVTSTDVDGIPYSKSWVDFSRGYAAAKKDWKVEETQKPTKDKESLYNRLQKCWYKEYSSSICKVVREFLLDEGLIEDEDEDCITITLQKSLLDTPNQILYPLYWDDK